MLKCDILITTPAEWSCNLPKDTVWCVRPITDAGMAVFQHYFADRVLQGSRSANVDTMMMRRICRYADQPKRDLTTHVLHMDDAIADVNARYLRNLFERDKIESDAADLMMPMIDAAMEARDKRRLTELHGLFPDTISRAFLIDRFRQAFPELKKPGVTLANWHLHDMESVDD